MATRKRDYRAEYAARNTRAQKQGYPSYWQQRQTLRMAQQARNAAPGPRGAAAAEDLIRKSKRPPKGQTPADVRRLWSEGQRAMRSRDFDRARKIAKRLGFRDRLNVPAQAIFYYH